MEMQAEIPMCVASFDRTVVSKTIFLQKTDKCSG